MPRLPRRSSLRRLGLALGFLAVASCGANEAETTSLQFSLRLMWTDADLEQPGFLSVQGPDGLHMYNLMHHTEMSRSISERFQALSRQHPGAQVLLTSPPPGAAAAVPEFDIQRVETALRASGFKDVQVEHK
jgi:hypothetical protein